MYDVEFPDCATKPYVSNTIAEKIHKYVDLYGHQYRPFGGILNKCKTANAVAIADAIDVKRDGRRYQRKSTSVWNLPIEMKDILEQWYPLKDMK